MAGNIAHISAIIRFFQQHHYIIVVEEDDKSILRESMETLATTDPIPEPFYVSNGDDNAEIMRQMISIKSTNVKVILALLNYRTLFAILHISKLLGLTGTNWLWIVPENTMFIHSFDIIPDNLIALNVANTQLVCKDLRNYTQR